MPKTALSRQKGFSLVELVIGLAIFLLVLIAIYGLFDTGSATYRGGQRKAEVQQNGRVALEEIVRQLRMAGYFPENFTTPAASPALTNQIQAGASNALAIYGDIDGDGTSNIIMYCLDTTVSPPVLRTGSAAADPVNSRGAAASAYACNNNVPVLAENITSLTFQYYDANNTLLPAPLDAQGLALPPSAPAIPDFTTTTSRRAVRTVVITLTARENIPHQQPQIYTLTSSVRLRNLN